MSPCTLLSICRLSTKAQTFQLACRTQLQSRTSRSTYRVLAPLSTRSYASHHNQGGHSRRAITVTSDDGRYSWSELSAGEKAARSTQQSFNFILVTAGGIGTVVVAYLLYVELFATDSKTRQFNRAVDRVKADRRCRDILGPANQIKAYGEPTSNKWARARPLAHSTEVDKYGTTHFRMHFCVEGPDGQGQVQVHMAKKKDQDELEYKLLSLTVPDHQTIYLENANATDGKRSGTRMFGVQWGR